MIRMLPILFAGSIFFLQSAYGQQAWTIYNDVNSPLPQNTIRCIAVDAQNRKWVGTDYGLAMYNDTVWTNYNTINTAGGLTDNGIRTFAFDPTGNLWIGTFNGGACRFDGTSWASLRVNNSSIPDDFVKAIAFDTSGHMWFGTPSGLANYDGTTWQVWDNNNSPLLSNHITSISIGNNNMKYIGTLNGGMVYFDGDTTWEFYNHINGLLPDNTVLSVALDSSGFRWAAMPAQGIIVHYGGLIFQWYNITNSLIPSSAVVHIMIDSLQTIYCSSQNEGFIVFNGTTFVNYKTANSPMPDDYVLCTAKDHNGILWVGTYNGGLVRVDESILASVNGVQETSAVNLYPNPTKDILYLAGIKPDGKSFTISDITGKLRFQKNISSVNFVQDVSFLPAGIYFVRIFSPVGIITKKFVKTN